MRDVVAQSSQQPTIKYIGNSKNCLLQIFPFVNTVELKEFDWLASRRIADWLNHAVCTSAPQLRSHERGRYYDTFVARNGNWPRR